MAYRHTTGLSRLPERRPRGRFESGGDGHVEIAGDGYRRPNTGHVVVRVPCRRCL